MKPDKDGYWLVKTEEEIKIVEVNSQIIYENIVIGISGHAWQIIGTFEREFKVIEWIKWLDINEL